MVIFEGFFFFDWRMWSLRATSRATYLPHPISPVITGKTMFTGLRTQFKSQVKLLPVHAMKAQRKADTQYWSFLPEHLARDRIRTLDHPVAEYATATPWEAINRNKREKCGKVWGIFCVSHKLCDYWRQFGPKNCAYFRQTWISQQGLPFRVQALNQGCTKPARWVAVLTIFSTAVRNICWTCSTPPFWRLEFWGRS